jgi:hypothetical protein
MARYMLEAPSTRATHRKKIMGQRPIMGILGENQEKDLDEQK